VRCALAVTLAALALPTAARAADPPLPATEVAQQIGLSQAAAAGIVGLTPKGAFGGDSVAVDLEGARVPGVPVSATVRIEFLGAQKNGAPWPAGKAHEIASAIESRLAASKASDGTPFRVTVVASVRAGTDPAVGATPGYHQIVLVDRPREADANTVSSGPAGPNGERAGNWGVHETVTTWAHETGHLLGLPDRYSARKPDFVTPDGTRRKLPEYTGSRDDHAAMDSWWETVLAKAAAFEKKYGKGDIQPGIPAGRENDIMGDGSGDDNAKPLDPRDIDALIAHAGVHLRANPGDVLLNKDRAQQNMVVGAGLDVYAPAGGKAHRDGLFAYCTDLSRHIPARESRFDVLGPASALAAGYPQYDALQKVTAEIGRRQLAPGADRSGPAGANNAIWAVTDAFEPTDPDAASILASAGVPYDPVAFSASPHFDDVNAAGAATAAVTPTAVAPAIPADRSRTLVAGDPFGLPAPALRYLALSSRRVRFGRHPKLVVLSLQDGSATRLTTLLLSRRGSPAKRTRVLGALTIAPGPQRNVIRLPVLRIGSYKLALVGPANNRHTLGFKVVRRRAR
jgi:hypothetical protein